MRTKTILRPNFDPRKEFVTLSDYYEVPCIETYGTWKVSDLVSVYDLLKMRLLHRELEGK